MSFFGSVLTSLVTLLHVYVVVRAGTLPYFRRGLPRKIVIGLGVGLWLLFFLGRAYGGNEGALSVALEVVGMHWMASVFLMAVGVFVADLACGFGFFFRGASTRIRLAGLGVGAGMVLLAHIQGLRPPAVVHYDVPIAGLAEELDGMTIGMMSDMHAGEMLIGSRWLKARVEQLQELEPDSIVLVGDLFERGCDPEEMALVLARLSAPLGVWAVRGNHDSLRPNRQDVTGEILAGAGVRLLSNEWSEMQAGVVIAGIDDLTSSRRRPGEGEANVELALANRGAGATVFLSHTPWMTDLAAAAGVDLMLSGHTHNGQIWPFNFLVGTRYPYVGGHYQIDGMSLIVTRGTGTWGPRMRLWLPGEISLIRLTRIDGD